VVHIAGTSGKTSTAYYLAALLGASGKKVGLTVSPHVDSLRERIQVNLQPISEAEFCEQLSKFMGLIETVRPEPTYFELLIAFVYWYFDRIGVDYAVIETGLGGMDDSTNVAQRHDKVCVITDIGFDHMHVLGHTLSEIALQKAGIVHGENQTFTYRQNDSVMRVFEDYIMEQNATLNVTTEDDERRHTIEIAEPLNDLPAYQQRNWLLAHRAFMYVQQRDQLPALSPGDLAATMSVLIPARMEVTTAGDKTIIMDGAHNQQKMAVFVESFQAEYPGTRAAILLALKEGKEYEAVLPLLQPITERLIITRFSTSQELVMRSLDPAVIADFARAHGFGDVTTQDDLPAAYAELKKSPESVLIVTGSFYLIGQVRALPG